MNTFIVMQGRTYFEEKEAGVIWVPQLDISGHPQHSWERMRTVKRGDVVFHYVNGYIVAVSVATTDCIISERPKELQNDSVNDKEMGYLVSLEYHELEATINVQDHFSEIEPFLPIKYSAFQANGTGNQGYLYPSNDELTIILLELIGEANIIKVEKEQLRFSLDAIELNEHHPLAPLITNTESKVKMKMRVNEHKLREKLEIIWQTSCPVCGIHLNDVLRVSRPKPWKDSTNDEKLDPYNGLLLCANHDALYTKGYISFDAKGKIRISPAIAAEDYARYLINPDIVIKVEPEHKKYLKWHLKNVLV
ncbi:HNH endonuclease [Rummeliibacillus sp. JY-2-4R]